MRFQRFEEERTDLGILRQFGAQLLDQLAHPFDVGAVDQPQIELHDHPVTRIVGQLLDLAEGDRVQRAIVVAKLKGAHGDLLDGALGAADIDVFAMAKRIVEQKERPRKDVADQRLRAEADRQPDDARTGEEGRHRNAEAGEQQHRPDADDGGDQDLAQERQKGGEARGALADFLGLVIARLGNMARLVGDLAVDPDAHGAVEHIGRKQDAGHSQPVAGGFGAPQQPPDGEEHGSRDNGGEDGGHMQPVSTPALRPRAHMIGDRDDVPFVGAIAAGFDFAPHGVTVPAFARRAPQAELSLDEERGQRQHQRAGKGRCDGAEDRPGLKGRAHEDMGDREGGGGQQIGDGDQMPCRGKRATPTARAPGRSGNQPCHHLPPDDDADDHPHAQRAIGDDLQEIDMGFFKAETLEPAGEPEDAGGHGKHRQKRAGQTAGLRIVQTGQAGLRRALGENAEHEVALQEKGAQGRERDHRGPACRRRFRREDDRRRQAGEEQRQKCQERGGYPRQDEGDPGGPVGIGGRMGGLSQSRRPAIDSEGRKSADRQRKAREQESPPDPAGLRALSRVLQRRDDRRRRGGRRLQRQPEPVADAHHAFQRLRRRHHHPGIGLRLLRGCDGRAGAGLRNRQRILRQRGTGGHADQDENRHRCDQHRNDRRVPSHHRSPSKAG